MAQTPRQPSIQAEETMPEIFVLKSTEIIFPEADAIQSEIRTLEQSSTAFQRATSQLQSLRVATTADVPPWGYNVLDTSVQGDVNRALVFVQDLSGAGATQGMDQGLLTTVVRGVDDKGLPRYIEQFEIIEKPSQPGFNVDQITARVIARDVDSTTAAETTAAAGAVAPASLLSRFVKCVRGSCAQVCLGSLTACAGVWPVYLKCVAVACGGCALKCAACAGCNCSFFCKWAVGCCKD